MQSGFMSSLCCGGSLFLKYTIFSIRFFWVGIFLIGCAGKTPVNHVFDNADLRGAILENSQLNSFDHMQLTVRRWTASKPKAVLIALHGMNDYGHAFDRAGNWWAQDGFVVYAYDQRGFGALTDDEVSIVDEWPGTQVFADDLRAMIQAVKIKHPELPVFVLGHSMGAGVVMIANAQSSLKVDGIILAAPAVWGGKRMPLFYRMTLSIANFFASGKTLTGKRAARQATDNIPILRGMQADPLVLKATPIRAIKGIVNLMGQANGVAHQQQGDILFLYGHRDEIIPIKAMEAVSQEMQTSRVKLTIKSYPDGWHLLFRDLQAETVWCDIASWIDDRVMD